MSPTISKNHMRNWWGLVSPIEILSSEVGFQKLDLQYFWGIACFEAKWFHLEANPFQIT